MATRALNVDHALNRRIFKMAENASTGNQGNEKTFTQAELDAIVSDRLSRERQKYADYDSLKEKADKFDEAEEANKSELQKVLDNASKLKNELDTLKAANTVREVREKVAKEMDIPASLLTGDNEEACKAQAEAIIAYAGGKPKKYPDTKDNNNQSQGGTSNDNGMREWARNLFNTKG